MPEPTGADLDAVRVRRDEIRDRYLQPRQNRPSSTAAGIHHAAFIARDVEETVRFYTELLGFPLVEMVENRDYVGSTHFFFDLGHGNLLGFFDFPGHDHPPFAETLGSIQHLAISVPQEQYERLRRRLDENRIPYGGPDAGIEESMYFRDPNGVPLELYREDLGRFQGETLVDP
jgi:glyoxylase I family protein